MTSPASEAAPLPASIGGVAVDDFLARVDHHMRELLRRRPGPVADAAARSVLAGGKRMRPLLVAAGYPLDAPRRDGLSGPVRAAAAIELLHTASLVHDDVLDGALVRRGVATVEASDGRRAATSAGDLLFSLAFETLTELVPIDAEPVAMSCVRTLARTARDLAEGEALQADQQRDPNVTRTVYEQRCVLKTGVLFEAALQLGATLGGARSADVRTLGSFGRSVGLAFQIADDILDCGLPSSAELLGKLPGADLRDGTITLPMLEAIAADPSIASELAHPVPHERIEPLLDQIRRTGGLERAGARAVQLRDDATTLLDELEGDFDVAALAGVAARSVDRIT